MGECIWQTLMPRGRTNLKTHVCPVAEKVAPKIYTKNANNGVSRVRPKEEGGVGVRREERRG